MDYRALDKIHKELQKLNCETYTLSIIFPNKEAINIVKAPPQKEEPEKKIGY